MAKMPQPSSLRRAALCPCVRCLPVWAVVAFFTGGVGWMLGPLRISSRQPLRPFIIGLRARRVVRLEVFARYEREADGRWLSTAGPRARCRSPCRWSSCSALYVGVHYGSFAAAGSDSYGYVSQARLWLSGNSARRAAMGAGVLVAES